MKQKYDFHVHTTYCDGADTPKSLTETAIENGFEILGFSGHGYTDIDLSFCMSRVRTDGYIDEITRLKDEYADKIEILCGIEQDYFANQPTSRFDYVIGSIHYLYVNGRYVPLDLEPSTMRYLIDEVYGGSFAALARDYYAQVADVVNRTECDIIGHFDLITKFIDRTTIIRDDEYYEAAFDAVCKLIPAKKPFEINLGAIARGYRTTPYPDEVILKEIKRLGGDIVITGDCHNKLFLGKNYDVAAKLAKQCGFDRQRIITKSGYEYKDI